jgi:hypothetical protein
VFSTLITIDGNFTRDFVLPPQAVFAGVVVDEDGSPAGGSFVRVFSRLVELSPTATGKAQQRNAPDDVFAKDALCSELLAGAGVDIPSGQHVLLLVAIPGRGGRMGHRLAGRASGPLPSGALHA